MGEEISNSSMQVDVSKQAKEKLVSALKLMADERKTEQEKLDGQRRENAESSNKLQGVKTQLAAELENKAEAQKKLEAGKRRLKEAGKTRDGLKRTWENLTEEKELVRSGVLRAEDEMKLIERKLADVGWKAEQLERLDAEVTLRLQDWKVRKVTKEKRLKRAEQKLQVVQESSKNERVVAEETRSAYGGQRSQIKRNMEELREKKEDLEASLRMRKEFVNKMEKTIKSGDAEFRADFRKKKADFDEMRSVREKEVNSLHTDLDAEKEQISSLQQLKKHVELCQTKTCAKKENIKKLKRELSSLNTTGGSLSVNASGRMNPEVVLSRIQAPSSGPKKRATKTKEYNGKRGNKSKDLTSSPEN